MRKPRIKMSEAEQREVRELKSKEKNNKIYRRLLYVEMSNKGMTNIEISSILGVCNDTLTDWRILYDEGGIKSLCTLQYKNQGQSSKLAPYKSEIKKREKEVGINRLKDLQGWLYNEYQVETCISNLYYFCKKNSIFLSRKQD